MIGIRNAYLQNLPHPPAYIRLKSDVWCSRCVTQPFALYSRNMFEPFLHKFFTMCMILELSSRASFNYTELKETIFLNNYVRMKEQINQFPFKNYNMVISFLSLRSFDPGVLQKIR